MEDDNDDEKISRTNRENNKKVGARSTSSPGFCVICASGLTSLGRNNEDFPSWPLFDGYQKDQEFLLNRRPLFAQQKEKHKIFLPNSGE